MVVAEDCYNAEHISLMKVGEGSGKEFGKISQNYTNNPVNADLIRH